MGGVAVQVSSNIIRRSSNTTVDFGTRNAVARILRRQFPTNGVKLTMAAFNLTEGEAKGAFYANASQNTIDKIKKKGGWPMVLEIEAMVLGQSLEDFIEQRRANERQTFEQRDSSLRQMAADLPRVLGVGPDGRDQ